MCYSFTTVVHFLLFKKNATTAKKSEWLQRPIFRHLLFQKGGSVALSVQIPGRKQYGIQDFGSFEINPLKNSIVTFSWNVHFFLQEQPFCLFSSVEVTGKDIKQRYVDGTNPTQAGE
jgi:hypothetical protein